MGRTTDTHRHAMPTATPTKQQSTIRDRVKIELIKIHRFNPRSNRPQEHIQRLADRMKMNGFEETRALWVSPTKDGYEVFAGGTRLLAAKMAGLDEVPVIVYEGYSDVEICTLADVDNDNDGYHVKVSLLDVWASCHYLATVENWIQDKIAEAKKCDRSTVATRIKLHEILPETIKQRVLDETLAEDAVIAIIGVVLDVQHFSQWLTTESAHLELFEEILETAERNGKRPTVKLARECAIRWKEFIAKAEDIHQGLEEEWQPKFVAQLAKMKARRISAVLAANDVIVRDIAEAKQREEMEERERLSEAEARNAEAQERLLIVQRRQEVLAKINEGDVVKLMTECPENFSLLLTEPPSQNLGCLNSVLQTAFDRAAEEASLMIICRPQHEQQIAMAIEDAGWTIRGWLVAAHSIEEGGDKKRTFAAQHKRIVYAVKGDPVIVNRSGDVFKADSIEMRQSLIKAVTHDRQTIVDPWANDGLTVYAALGLDRDFWAIEADAENCDTIRAALTASLEARGSTQD